MAKYSPRFSRFDRLTDMVYVQVIEGTDVLLDLSDATLLLEGIEYLRTRHEFLRKRGRAMVQKRSHSKGRTARRAISRAQANLRLERELLHAKQIALNVAAEHGFDLDTLRGARQEMSVVIARHQAIRTIESQCPLLCRADIARIIGCDRSTVRFALGCLKGRTPPHLREAA